ncbi:auxin efflux carrier family protein [Roseobacter sp. SK209-2-6]|uniref:AEC family transporter n=1 Tax=Roseobacter sp. SK209-2-6 TaxID=388739 RepID=UPI0000F3F3F0|nr:AEC family transporter [Roseobacter sp. SK209-2-6]EBA14659.1 auxin efflux carrier family protein [Roseobacter sp. SK209-2-6]
MTQILAITFPIYAAMALGYLVVRKGWFDPGEMRTLGKYVLNIALPFLLFNAVATRDLSEVIRPDYIAVYALGGLGCMALSYVFLTLRGIDPRRRALGIMGSSCPNSAYIGYPILLLAVPDLAPVALALNFLVENLLLVPLCLILIEMASGKAEGPLWRRISAMLRNVLGTPFFIGLMLGVFVSLLQLPVPAPVTRLAALLAASASALSLVVIGGSMVGLPLHGNRALASQIALQKLLLHPALVGLAALGLGALGVFQISPEILGAVVLSAAMPMFTIYTVLAQRQGLEGAASLAMLIATSGAFVTLSVLLWLLT